MKVTRYNRGYSIRASDHEMAVLRAALKVVDPKALAATLSKAQHRSMACRTCWGHFLRTDEDKRSGLFRDMPYDGPHNDQ